MPRSSPRSDFFIPATARPRVAESLFTASANKVFSYPTSHLHIPQIGIFSARPILYPVTGEASYARQENNHVGEIVAQCRHPRHPYRVLVLRNENNEDILNSRPGTSPFGIPSAPGTGPVDLDDRRRMAPPPYLADRDRCRRSPDGSRRARHRKGTRRLRRTRPRRRRLHPHVRREPLVDNMHRYETRFTRQIDRAAARLSALQEKRARRDGQPQTAQQNTTISPNGDPPQETRQ